MTKRQIQRKGRVAENQKACNWCDTPSNRPAASSNRRKIYKFKVYLSHHKLPMNQQIENDKFKRNLTSRASATGAIGTTPMGE